MMGISTFISGSLENLGAAKILNYLMVILIAVAQNWVWKIN
jgi:hypothetical protein